MTERKKNKILMIALDFPPCHSAGVQRTLKFCEYLPEFNWEPVVLSAKSFIYNKVDEDIELPVWLEKSTYRAFGFNAFKHFSIKGKYFSFTALPDPYATWYWHAVFLGKKLLKKHQPDIIWSTHPCLTSLKIANKLKKTSGLPWVADFRDPFKGHHSSNKNDSGLKIDKDTANNADLLVFATSKMAELYKKQYPHVNKDKFVVIENGFNEEIFRTLESKSGEIIDDSGSDDFTLLHSGEVYENGRDPGFLLDAIKLYKNSLVDNGRKLKVIFRGAKLTRSLQDKILSHNIEDCVQFLPATNYLQSIHEMLNADGLLVLQGEVFNNQIPGKIYEYIRSKKPILALVNKNGATAELLNGIDHAVTADIKTISDICDALISIQSRIVNKSFDYHQYDRKNRCKDLADSLDKLLA